MDWKTLYLNANGRIGQRDFWIGWVILFVATLILGLIPVIGHIIGLVLIYPTVCVYSKRLHDFGKSGWLVAIPYAVFIIAAVIGVIAGGSAILMGASAGANASAAAAGALGGLGLMMLFLLIAFVVAIAFLLWVGLSKGDAGPNRYGPPPVSLTGGAGTNFTPA